MAPPSVALDKDKRKQCWAARDSYWACLDQGNGLEPCAKLREVLVAACPPTWVAHYDRRYEYLKYKDMLEKHGYDGLQPGTTDGPK